MDNTYLIGITGRAGSGKDTLAEMLGYARYAFAKPLKDMLAAGGFPEPARPLKEALIPGFNFSWRRAAQTLGTEWGRGLQGDLWLAMAKRYRLELQADYLVITDVRFHNEADWIRECGTLVHVKGRAAELDSTAQQHASEIELPVMPGDYTIFNQGSLNVLKNYSHSLMGFLSER